MPVQDDTPTSTARSLPRAPIGPSIIQARDHLTSQAQETSCSVQTTSHSRKDSNKKTARYSKKMILTTSAQNTSVGDNSEQQAHDTPAISPASSASSQSSVVPSCSNQGVIVSQPISVHTDYKILAPDFNPPDISSAPLITCVKILKPNKVPPKVETSTDDNYLASSSSGNYVGEQPTLEMPLMPARAAYKDDDHEASSG